MFALVSMWLSAVHFLEELMSRDETLFEYAGPLVGYRLSGHSGAIALLLNSSAQTVLALYAYTFQDLTALSLLAGLRLGDAVGSHSLLSLAFRRDNPGIFSASLLVVESWVICTTFGAESVPFFIGLCAFVVPWSVLLVLHFARRRNVIQ